MATVTQHDNATVRDTAPIRVNSDDLIDMKQFAVDQLRATGQQPTLSEVVSIAWRFFRADTAKKGKR